MLRILGAFAWMRWRVLVNSLERTGARDTLERLSLALEHLGPLMAIALLAPSALALAALGGYAGHTLAATGGSSPPLTVLRYLLLAATAFSILGPILLPAVERTNVVRLLLLPIPRRLLYFVQSGSALTDPWIVLATPAVAAVPIGLAAGGSALAAAVAAGAGALLLVALLGLTSLVTSVMHLLLRDRRRGEVLALVFIVFVPVIGMLPALLQDRGGGEESTTRARGGMPDWLLDTGSRAFSALPSELYTTAVTDATVSRTAAVSLAGLGLLGLVLHAAAGAAFGRMLDGPVSGGARRGAAREIRWRVRVPGVSPAAAAVAANQWRLTVRTPRGRSILLTPIPVIAVFSLFMQRSGGSMDLGLFTIHGGLALAVFGALVSLTAVLPFAMNQFAIDGAGLTLQFLAPLDEEDLLVGKALGGAAAAAVPTAICAALALFLFPGGRAAYWLAILPGAAAAYLLVAPAAAVLSALLPRSVDLNAIGNASNSHGLAGLAGLLAVALAVLVSVAIAWTAALIGRPWLGPVLLVVWCAIALALCRLLLRVAARVVRARRENLALVV